MHRFTIIRWLLMNPEISLIRMLPTDLSKFTVCLTELLPRATCVSETALKFLQILLSNPESGRSENLKAGQKIETASLNRLRQTAGFERRRT